MKLNVDIKNKKYNAEVDVEKLIEKGMDNHEKDWKDKFSTKHEAKKEMLELKQKHKLELGEQNQKKKSIFDKIKEIKEEEHRHKLEEQDRLAQLELEKEKRRLEEQARLKQEKKKRIKMKIISSIVMGIIGIALIIVGIILINKSSNPEDSAWTMLCIIGFFLILGIACLWATEIKNQN